MVKLLSFPVLFLLLLLFIGSEDHEIAHNFPCGQWSGLQREDWIKTINTKKMWGKLWHCHLSILTPRILNPVSLQHTQLDHFSYIVCWNSSFCFCLSVCYYRDYSDLCFRWISKILTYAQGTIHSWVLHFLFHHGISYDHSGNDTVFEHHFLSPVPLWWPFPSLARSSCKIVSWIALNEWRHQLSLKAFFCVCGHSGWDLFNRFGCSNISENLSLLKLILSQTSPK